MEEESNEHSHWVIKTGFPLNILDLGFKDQTVLTEMELVL